MQTGKGICIPTAWINIMLTCFELTVSKSLKCFFFNLICICTLLSPVKLNMATSKRGKQYLPYLPLYIFATALILLHNLVAYLFLTAFHLSVSPSGQYHSTQKEKGGSSLNMTTKIFWILDFKPYFKWQLI